MARGDVFNEMAVVEEMLALRMAGATFADLARRYGVDHTSIMYQCRKYDIGNGVLVPVKLKRKQRTPLGKHTPQQKVVPLHPILAAERLNPGKRSYAEYVRAANERRYAHLRVFHAMQRTATITSE